MKLKGLMKMFILSDFHVIRTIRSTRGIEGTIFCFHVHQNFVFSDFVLTGLDPLYIRTYSVL